MLMRNIWNLLRAGQMLCWTQENWVSFLIIYFLGTRIHCWANTMPHRLIISPISSNHIKMTVCPINKWHF